MVRQKGGALPCSRCEVRLALKNGKSCVAAGSAEKGRLPRIRSRIVTDFNTGFRVAE